LVKEQQTLEGKDIKDAPHFKAEFRKKRGEENHTGGEFPAIGNGSKKGELKRVRVKKRKE